jgi:large conductance mechanosensitive channel
MAELSVYNSAMLRGFKEFLLKTNALALAVGVIIGGAVGKVVSSLVSDILMPFISLAIPSGGDWRTAHITIGTALKDGKVIENNVNYGTFAGAVVDFVIIAFCVYLITKSFIKEPAPAPAAPTKTCPRCKETVPADSTRCKFCTSDI